MPPVIVEHVLPGRIRLRFPDRRRDTAFFEQIISLLSQHPAVEEARANPLTGSLLVRHSGPIEELAGIAVQTGLIGADTLAELMKRPMPTGSWARLFVGQGQQLPTVALALLGVLQMARGRIFGPASELFWHTRELWQRGRPFPALGLALLGLIQLSRTNLFGSATSLLFYGLMLQNERQTARRTAAEARGTSS